MRVADPADYNLPTAELHAESKAFRKTLQRNKGLKLVATEKVIVRRLESTTESAQPPKTLREWVDQHNSVCFWAHSRNWAGRNRCGGWGAPPSICLTTT